MVISRSTELYPSSPLLVGSCVLRAGPAAKIIDVTAVDMPRMDVKADGETVRLVDKNYIDNFANLGYVHVKIGVPASILLDGSLESGIAASPHL
jgi:hypothetical protein